MCYFVVLWIQAVSSQFGVVSKFDLILLTILCTAVSNYISPGHPHSTISWTAPNKDVYRLNTAINYDGIEVNIDGSLLITNLTDGDNGTYTCAATNLKGWYKFLDCKCKHFRGILQIVTVLISRNKFPAVCN